MKQQSITSLPPAPDAERRSRMIKYSVAMSIRVLCLLSILFIRGWWILIPAMGAIFLPYFAVVLANVSSGSRSAAVERPGNVLPAKSPADESADAAAPHNADSDANDKSAE